MGAGAKGPMGGFAKTAMSAAGPLGMAASGALSIAEGAMAISAANEKSKAAGATRVKEQQAARQQSHQSTSAALGAEGVVGSAREQATADSLHGRDVALLEAKQRENETKAAAKSEAIMGGLQIAGGALQTVGGGMEAVEKFKAPQANLKESLSAVKGGKGLMPDITGSKGFQSKFSSVYGSLPKFG